MSKNSCICENDSVKLSVFKIIYIYIRYITEFIRIKKFVAWASNFLANRKVSVIALINSLEEKKHGLNWLQVM